MDKNQITALVAFIVCFPFFFGIFAKVFRDRFSKVRTVKATVTGKYKLDAARKVYGSSRPVLYRVTFQPIKGRRRSYVVSELTWRSLQEGDSGILKYKGSKFVDFQ